MKTELEDQQKVNVSPDKKMIASSPNEKNSFDDNHEGKSQNLKNSDNKQLDISANTNQNNT